MNSLYADLFHAAAPETVLVVSALLVLGFDLVVGRHRTQAQRLVLATFLGGLGVLAALAVDVAVGATGPVFGGALMLDPLAVAVRGGVLVLVLLTLGVASAAPVSRQPAEYVALILFAAVGFLRWPPPSSCCSASSRWSWPASRSMCSRATTRPGPSRPRRP